VIAAILISGLASFKPGGESFELDPFGEELIKILAASSGQHQQPPPNDEIRGWVCRVELLVKQVVVGTDCVLGHGSSVPAGVVGERTGERGAASRSAMSRPRSSTASQSRGANNAIGERPAD
jgi:hypothetical protein